ncbi:GPW/gp25 family protein [Sphaerotilaceae bacterium SBD11-9]
MNQSFLGTGWGFPPSFDPRNKHAEMVSHEQDIEESLRILLSTTPGERVMQPSYGCPLRRMVFESVNESTLTEIRDLISKAVLFFEVRISLEHIEIDTEQLFDGLLRIRLDYTIRRTNTRSNMVYPLYLTQGTSLRQDA